MNDIIEVARQVKDTEFLPSLLSEFVARGLGSLPGRETTITLVGLLLKHHPEWRGHPPSDYEIARLLRTSPRKIRNVRDEIDYRDGSRDSTWCRERLIEVLKNAERVRSGRKLSFQIDDGLVRDYAQKQVRENWGVVERGMNASIMQLSPAAFVALVVTVMPDDKEFLEAIKKQTLETDQNTEKDKTLIRLFAENFAKKAGVQAGVKSVRLASLVLTGGAEAVSEAIEFVRNLLANSSTSQE